MKKMEMSDNKFKSLISKICRDIMISNWTPDYIVGITRGGAIPAIMISHYLNIPCHTLQVSLRDNDNNCETNCWMSEDAFGYSDTKKNILIVDDINDTGATINWIKNDWMSSCLPHDDKWNDIWGESVRFAVVVDNLSSKNEVPVSYCGMEIDKDFENIWVEFPYEVWWRNYYNN